MACVQGGGIYYLTNVKGGSCLDLSGGNNRSIIGYGYHNGTNQAWVFERADGDRTYYLKSVGTGKYLAPAGELHDGQSVVAVEGSRYPWLLQDEQGVDRGVRLLPAENPNFCLDLSDNGNSTPGTPVQLWGRWGGLNQVWELHKYD